MAEREDTGYKVTDRRKYNPDGTPRENPEPEPESPSSDDSVRVLTPTEEPAASNVLSFPGETKRQAEPPPPEVDEPQVELEEAAPPARDAEAQAAQAAAATQAEQAYSQARGPANPQLAEASFLGLANMLGVEAAMHLGVIRPPGDEPPPVDLESARHLIDMLGILQSKTSGNLTPEEDRFLDGVLADLRMSFVEISRAMKVTFLGTGTSVGVPSVGCECATCLSDDPRDKRLRTSVLIEHGGNNLLIDASTDFRQQALRVGLKHLAAILFTHSHADHCFGLDDTRPIMFRDGAISVYATDVTWEGLRRIYAYAFEPSSYPGVPRIVPHTIDGEFSVMDLRIEPLTVLHGKLAVTAFRIGEFGYVTDCNVIPDETCSRLLSLDVLVIDALRFKKHPTHMTLDQALEYVERLKPKRALLTHISHDIKHAETSQHLPERVEIAYDGLVVEV